MKWVIGLLVGLVLAFVLFHVEQDDANRRKYEAAKARVDTLYVQRTDTLRLTRRVTDSILVNRTDTLIHRDTVVQIVERERAACDAVIQTCEEKVSLRNLRIAELERGERLFGIKLPSRTIMFGAGILGGFLLAK